MKKIHLIILTPYGQYLDDYVDFISTRSDEFTLGILPNHAPMITTLKISKLTITKDGKKENYAIGGGVLHILDDKSVHLLLESIEHTSEIDISRALESKKRAEDRLNRREENIDIKRAEISLARALNRIEVFNNNN